METKQTVMQYAKENKQFAYWRTRTFYSIIIGYAAYYIVRQNFSIAIPALCAELGITKTDLGIALSTGGILYGVGKFLFGLIGDKYSARYVMSIGLAISGILNILLGINSILPAIVILYSLNQCFQSMGNPPCAKMLANWHGASELGSKWAIWNSSCHIGSALANYISPIILVYFGWRSVFYFPGIFAILLSIFLFNRLRDTPASLGFPSIDEIEGAAPKKLKIKLSFSETVKLVLSNKYVWCVAMANFFVYINRMTFQNWGPTLLQEARGSSMYEAGFQMVLFELAGMCGGLLAGVVSDKLFKGRRAPVAALCLFLMTTMTILFKFIPRDSYWLNAACMMGIGSMSTAPVMLIGIAATDFTSKKAAGSATGFTGTLGYFGTVVAGAGNGYLADNFGWDAVVVCTIISALCGTILLASLWNKQPVAKE